MLGVGEAAAGVVEPAHLEHRVVVRPGDPPDPCRIGPPGLGHGRDAALRGGRGFAQEPLEMADHGVEVPAVEEGVETGRLAVVIADDGLGAPVHQGAGIERVFQVGRPVDGFDTEDDGTLVLADTRPAGAAIG